MFVINANTVLVYAFSRKDTEVVMLYVDMADPRFNSTETPSL